MHFEFERADAVRDPLKIIAQTMGEVVHRVDAPLVTSVMVIRVADAIDDRVAQPDVGRGHVDLRAQRAGAVGEFTRAHPGEEIEILLHRTGTEGTVLAGTIRRSAIFLHLGRSQIADKGMAQFNQADGEFVNLVEVI